jgi:hypothetical protein
MLTSRDRILTTHVTKPQRALERSLAREWRDDRSPVATEIDAAART